MPAPAISLLIDARKRPPRLAPLPPHIQVLVAGPEQPIDLPATTPEGVLFHALVDAARAPLCVWHRAGDQPTPDRLQVMHQAIAQLQVPVVSHRPPGSTQPGSGRFLRLPGPVVTRGTRVIPDTLAFRREVAAFAPQARDRLHGTRRALLNWAATRDSVGWIDRNLLTRPASPPEPPEVRIQGKIIRTQASLTAFYMVQQLNAPQPLVDAALQYLLDQSQDWTWSHWDLLQAHKRPQWSPPAGGTS